MLNTNGYYLLDDTSTALRTEAAGALPSSHIARTMSSRATWMAISSATAP